jgi:putative ABC transport system substrate-binding protein
MPRSRPSLFAKVDVILAGGTEPAIAAKQATSVIPIVFPTAGDPVGSRLVRSLARPGGNVTGLSNQAMIFLPSVSNSCAKFFQAFVGWLSKEQIDAAARALSLELVPLPVRRMEDITSALEGLKGGGAEALFTTGDPLVNTHQLRIIIFALAARLPTMFSQREYVAAGGLMSYGPNYPDLNRRAAHYVDKVLRGAKPGDLPVEQPTKFDLVINLITAKALGLTLPGSLLARTDEVIERGHRSRQRPPLHSGHADHGYEPTREAAMAAFAEGWPRE